MRNNVIHPPKSDLALLAGADLGWFRRLRVNRHVRNCAECRDEVETYSAQRELVKAAAPGIPPHLDWGSLAAEMKANIRLGISAAECISRTPVHQRIPVWRPVAVMACAVVLVLGGWMAQRPSRPAASPELQISAHPPIETVLKASAAGVGVERDGHAMTLMHAGRPALTAVSAGTHGSVNARYIDEDTGQVTIHHVYSE